MKAFLRCVGYVCNSRFHGMFSEHGWTVSIFIFVAIPTCLQTETVKQRGRCSLHTL